MDELPIVYVRGYAGPSSQIDVTVDDPFYGFNEGATHVRIGGDGDPMFYQFEGPLLRLMTEHGYRFLVRGDQKRYLETAAEPLPPASIWVHRYYDEVATTFAAPKKRNFLEGIVDAITSHVDDNGFDIERAAAELYDLVVLVLQRTGAPKVNLVAHSMGGLVARCMMQKVCETPVDGTPRRHAKDIVAKLFTYGTPHGGIQLALGAANWAMDAFGPAGSDVFSPAKMYGYLTPGKTFGDRPPAGSGWDPQRIPPDIFDADDVFCLIGTDPNDYTLTRVAVGPKSDGLVLIEHAYVRGAHRAYVYKSHSGRYGEVNSEEGYQNLSRFLFGTWMAAIAFAGLPGSTEALAPGDAWQADMGLSIRGLPIVMSEQQAAHWCPIQLNEEILHEKDTVDAPIPIVRTFLMKKEPPTGGAIASDADVLVRYALRLRVYKLTENNGGFDFADHLEQISDWSDTLIVDIGPEPDGTGFGAWTAWNSTLPGPIDATPRMPVRLELHQRDDGTLTGTVALPDVARGLPVFGENASLAVTVARRVPVEAAPAVAG
ncbi:hypothetical protein [Leifsonia sp. NPDC080035]|uniref:GPI inositol-deacylase PGAP1-like alpha/beta domain-containing protein n=1 Tax=Leifsonia sp. NPDC080035 TaxID=3143936 RepID=A0AAU7GC55_9MICO